MNYCLFKLRFLTPLCAGDGEDARGLERAAFTLGGDTLFSALCQEALAAGGREALERLAGWAREDRLRLSDLLPFWGEELLIPRPVLPRPRIPRTLRPREDRAGAGERKRMKKLGYLPLTALADYLAALRGEGEMDPDGWQREVGEAVLRTQVFLGGGEDPVPYTVGAFRFYGDAPGDPLCGLYGVAGFDPAAEELPGVLFGLLRGLGVGGIGGKRGVGFGRFEVAEAAVLRAGEDPRRDLLLRLLEAGDAPGQLLLTTSLPAGEELAEAMEGAWYQLRRRGGFINSRDYSPRPVKRRTQYFFAPGSVFARRYRGELTDLGRGGGHPVYRCSRPLFLGVTP